MPTRSLAAVLALTALVTVACGRLTGGDGTGSTGATGGSGIEHPTGPDDLVLRVEYQGGFVPYEYTLSSLPMWSLFGDGTLVVQGPQIEIYPPPALPNLLRMQISEEGVQAILEAARDAGLLDGDASYGNDCVADAATTVFTTNAGGTTSVVSAYALDLADPQSDCEENPQARAALREFQMALGDLQSWLPEGAVGAEEPFETDELRVFVMPYRGEPDLPQEPMAWPLEGSLDAFGEPVADAPEPVRCGTVTGEDLATVLDAAAGANQLTPWTSDGGEHRLIFRPLLPDESGC